MGKISDERFVIMSANFEAEQKELREEYLQAIRKSFKAQLDNIEIVD